MEHRVADSGALSHRQQQPAVQSSASTKMLQSTEASSAGHSSQHRAAHKLKRVPLMNALGLQDYMQC